MPGRDQPAQGVEGRVGVEASVAAEVEGEPIGVVVLFARVEEGDQSARWGEGRLEQAREPLAGDREFDTAFGFLLEGLQLVAAAAVAEGAVSQLMGEDESQRRGAAVRVTQQGVEHAPGDADISAATGE